MKILCLIPPYVPSYFNAGHHLPIFQVGSYLRTLDEVEHVTCIDACAVHYTWKEIGDIFLERYDLVVMLNDFDAIDSFARTVEYIRTLSPQSRILTFGRLSQQIPGFFERYGFDAIHCAGDAEVAVADYVHYLWGNQQEPSGVALRQGSTYSKPLAGRWLPAEEWVLPDVSEIPFNAHKELYANDLNKFCGIPQRQELVIPLARGCPVGCSYCDVPRMQGLRERRLSVQRVIDYIHNSFQRYPLEYVSFYAPTFTLDKRWVRDFCQLVIERESPWPWKCVTTVHHLSEDLVQLMSQARCIRISVGLETLSTSAAESLPRIKQQQIVAFERLAGWCQTYGIELNCFIILGLPGDTPEGVRATIERARSLGARIRPTIYTPYQEMRPDMTEREVAQYNRQLFADGVCDPETAQEYYRLFFRAKEDEPTHVMEQIPLQSTAL